MIDLTPENFPAMAQLGYEEQSVEWIVDAGYTVYTNMDAPYGAPRQVEAKHAGRINALLNDAVEWRKKHKKRRYDD